MQVGVPEGTYREIEQVVRSSGQWMSVVDFMREAAKEKLDRWKAAGHQLPAGPSPDAFVEGVSRDRAGRERKPTP